MDPRGDSLQLVESLDAEQEALPGQGPLDSLEGRSLPGGQELICEDVLGLALVLRVDPVSRS